MVPLEASKAEDNIMNIVTTIGPASWEPAVVRQFLQLGVHCVRFPFAKETPEAHSARAAQIRELSRNEGIPVLLMADLPGGKPRLTNPEPLGVTSDRQYRIAPGVTS